MTALFISNLLSGYFNWLPAKRIIFYFLLQGDLIVLLLFLILIYEVKRWNRLKKR